MDSSTRKDPSGGKNQVRKRGWENFLPERPLRVLLVEDDDSTRQVVCALLCKCGYEVNPVSDGLKAWDLMERSDEQFDLVLTDAAMPLLSGTDLLTKIMMSEVHRDTPVIMMSAHDSLEVVFKCLLRGAKDFLVKPLRKNELRNLWQHVWRRNHASTRFGRGSPMTGRRKKAKNLSGSGDASSVSRDDTSQCSDRTARSQSDKGSATQNLWNEPPAADKDLPMLPDGVLAVQQGHTKHVCQMEHVHEGRSLLPEDGGIDKRCLNCKTPGERLSMSPQQCVTLSEGSEASERSAKAIDLIGTMTLDSRPGKNVWKSEDEGIMCEKSESSIVQDSLHVSQKPSSLPALELTLKRPSPSEGAWCRADANKSVKWSDCSAFSRYTSGALFQQRQCITIGAPRSCDLGSVAEDFRSQNGDRAVTTNNTTSLCVKPNTRAAAGMVGSCGSSTLHFPRAVPFQQGRQDGNSAICFLASCGDCDGRRAGHKRNLHYWGSPPLKLSSANSSLLSNETLAADNGQACPHNLQKPIYSNASPRLSEVLDKEICNESSDHFKYESQRPRHCHPQSSSSVIELAVSALEGERVCQKVLQSAPSGIETEATGRDTSGGLNVSGSGSNTGSNDGNTPFSCHLRGQAGKPAPAQESCSFSDFVKTDETSVANCSGAAASDAEVHCAVLPSDFSRVTLREAALNKFRLKRQVRCFEKKVRYQSRKKLAEQRPRVKGQFVRQAVYDASLSKLEQDIVCS